MLRSIGFFLREALYRLATAFVQRFMSKIAVEIVLTVCGLWCLVTPLMLWVAWTQSIFLLILGSSFLSCAIFCLVSVAIQPPPRRRKQGSLELGPPKARDPDVPPRRPTWRDYS